MEEYQLIMKTKKIHSFALEKREIISNFIDETLREVPNALNDYVSDENGKFSTRREFNEITQYINNFIEGKKRKEGTIKKEDGISIKITEVAGIIFKDISNHEYKKVTKYLITKKIADDDYKVMEVYYTYNFYILK